MPPPQSEDDLANSGRTLAEFFYYLRDPARRKELEAFRIKFEAAFGDTDLTRRWTSTLSSPERQWLIQNHPRRYWAGLPPFVQAFVKHKMGAAQRRGDLDDMPDSLLALFLAGEMEVDGDNRSR